MSPASGSEISAAAQLACLLEASAPKPGNVSPGRHFPDLRYEDFLAAAVAIGDPLAGVGTRSLGATVRMAVEATARWTRSNTNLGIVLLLAPLAHAAADARDLTPSLLRAALAGVLDRTTVADARDVYTAIRRAAPGGLGQVDAQDVADEPEVTLREAMCLAADRDGVAREYATDFEVTFSTAAPALVAAREDGLAWDAAIVETFLTLLAAHPDTHIVRRAGVGLAAEVSERARRVLGAGGVRSDAGRLAVRDMDHALRERTNRANPGTTADLTAAAIFVCLLGGGWRTGGPG